MLSFPYRPPGTISASALAIYEAEVTAFVAELEAIDATLDFKVSSRGWCYILEGKNVITKDDFTRVLPNRTTPTLACVSRLT